ncbi:MAG: protein-L-isoaspartate(D-aspartate) O-methyltransferase, partial [Hyphomicrobiales bacterium]|nr:protein-L-isoaspartate(D-aspartate) O-methyltransferase [Hyphomicrobiales bacterium]
VGCTTGYSAAVLAKLAANVVALEEDPALARIAAENLGARVAVVGGPLNAGWQADAPYDAILLEGASEVRPDRLLAQLKEGGRLVAVIGSAPLGKATLFRKDSGQITPLALFDAAAPLLPGFANTPAFVF